jgi:hypothetical protein
MDCAKQNKSGARQSMLGIVSLVSIVFGTAAASLAERCGKHVEAIETGAGVLLLGGFALIGSALPVML